MSRTIRRRSSNDNNAMHLLIPYACMSSSDAYLALQNLKLPNLERLLSRLMPSGSDFGELGSLHPPHERTLARLQGLPLAPASADGCLPLAAWALLISGGTPDTDAWAWITPCHWTVNSDHVVMSDPKTLALTEVESRTLLEAAKPYFEEDGIRLEFAQADRWLARSELFRDLATASIDRVAGSTIDEWLPRAPQAAKLRRLQSEMQMLLYTHPVNDERQLNGQAPINSFWVSGSGALPSGAHMSRQPTPDTVWADDLRDFALAQDWSAWSTAWTHLDAGHGAVLLQHLDSGQTTTLTLCGDRSALTLTNRPGGKLTQFMHSFGRKPLYSLRNQL